MERVTSSNEILAVLIAAVLSAVGWLAVRIVQGRPNVAWAFSHQHAFNLRNLNPPILAYTKEIWVQNVGRITAEDVEVVLGARPQHFDVWPQRHFEELENPDGSLTVKFDNLNRREHVTISLFQTAIQPPLVTNVRWRGGVGKQRPMAPQQVYPVWVRLLLFVLVLFGFFSFWYFLLRLTIR